MPRLLQKEIETQGMIRLSFLQNLHDVVSKMGLEPLRPELKIQGKAIQYLNLDTRTLRLEPGVLFFAHKGKNHDSHKMAAQVSGDIAALVLEYAVELPAHLADVPVFLAPNGMQAALNAWAKAQRAVFKGKVIGITGSNGKTIVKEWLAQVLQQKHRVYKSPGSYNSELGVALSLIQLDLNAEWALIEAGISHPGDMDCIQKLVLPDFGVFTHWGSAHAAHFGGDLQAVLHEKLLLFRSQIPWIGPYKAKALASLMPDVSAPVFTIGDSSAADVWGNSNAPFQFFFPGGSMHFPAENWTLVDAENARTVLACLKLIGFEPTEFEASLLKLESLPMRLRTEEGKRGRLILDDSYSMDEEALFLAVQKLHLIAGTRFKAIVLSDFPEGDGAVGFYSDLLERLRLYGFDLFIGIGEKWGKLQEQVGTECRFFKNLEAAKEIIHSILPEDAAVLVKGGRSARLEELVQQLKLASHRSQLSISVSGVLRNLAYFKSKLPEGVKLMVMVKAANYGIGYRELPILLQNYGVDYFGVAFADEGVALRKLGIQIPILVLNAQAAEFDLLQRYDLEPELYSVSMVKAWMQFVSSSKQGSLPGCHLKINTGMNRLGIDLDEIPRLKGMFPVLPKGFRLLSVFSHFMASGNPNKDHATRQQALFFTQACALISDWIETPFFRHISNSDAQERFPEFQFDMARLGIGLYGPQYSKQPLEEALKLSSYVLQVREVKAGAHVGYGAEFRVVKDSRVAVVALGYADGFKRILSCGKGQLLIHGHLCPILGNVCMDLSMVDVSGIPENLIQEGDEVLVFGPGFPLWQHAEQAETIPYEILTSIASRIPRVFVYD
jgi:alanine racemase